MWQWGISFKTGLYFGPVVDTLSKWTFFERYVALLSLMASFPRNIPHCLSVIVEFNLHIRLARAVYFFSFYWSAHYSLIIRSIKTCFSSFFFESVCLLISSRACAVFRGLQAVGINNKAFLLLFQTLYLRS